MEEYKEIILKALDYTSILSSFEFDFINDLAETVDDFDFKLSSKQEYVLDRIGAKIS